MTRFLCFSFVLFLTSFNSNAADEYCQSWALKEKGELLKVDGKQLY